MISLIISGALAASAFVSPLAPPLTVEKPFDAPSVAWRPGHRGVDLAASVGTPVRASGPGRVVFAGWLAGRYVVSVEHSVPAPGLGIGWRTTYEPVRPHVVTGQGAVTGQVIGTIDTSGGHCACLHWGLRRGRSYADPLLLLGRPIVLKPLTG